MLDYFKPTWVLDQLSNLTAEQLKKRGFKGVLVDLDNTLIAWDHPDATQQSLMWVEDLKASGIRVVIVSNNTQDRVGQVAEQIDVDFVSDSMKPLKKGFKEGMRKLDLPKDQILVIGDQLITDVLGANRIGLHSVLVRPIVETDAWFTKINRFLENQIKKISKEGNARWEDSFNGQ